MESKEVKGHLESIEGLLPRIGIEKEDEFEEELEDGRTVLGINCDYRSEIIQFYGIIGDETEFIAIRYTFDVIENLASDIKNSEQESVEEFIPEEDEDYISQAKDELASYERTRWADIKYGLYERLISENCYFHVNDGEDVPLESFIIETRYFPEVEKVNVSKISDYIQTILSKGAIGRLWLVHCLDKKEEAFLNDADELGYEKSDKADDFNYIG